MKRSWGTSLTILVRRTLYERINVLRLWEMRELFDTNLLAASYMFIWTRILLRSILISRMSRGKV